MEIKSELLKPYTENQRMDFIVEQNHNNGYEIRETEQALQAWGYTQEEIAEQEQKRLNGLTMTSLDLIKIVKSFGLTDEDIEEFLNANIGIKHELEFCQNVYCGIVKSFCPIIIKNFELTKQMVEDMFIRKNTTEEQE